MKKILFICSALLLINCGGNDKDCNCTQQRWERKATFTIGTPNNPSTWGQFISATEWQKVGAQENANTDDCSKNGSISSKGDANSWTNTSAGTYTNLQYEYRVTCQ